MGAIFKTISKEIKFFYPNTRIGIIGIALLISLLPLPIYVSYGIVIIFILSIGLMHGATDHLLYINAQGLSLNNSIPRKFFVKYLITLISMVAIWWLIPSFALGLFIITSAYHFGQTQWQYLKITERSILKKSIYTSWGLLILLLIVIFNDEESNALIHSVGIDIDVNSFQPMIYISFVIWVLLLLYFRGVLEWRALAFEGIELLIIIFFSWRTDLLISFGLFFGLWHSLRASQVQIDKIKEDQPFTTKDFIKGSLPFTLISLFGIFLLIFLSSFLNETIKTEMLFLIAISALTMPHMIIYEEFYGAHNTD